MQPLFFRSLFDDEDSTPAWLSCMDTFYNYTSTHLNYAITDVMDDIERINRKMEEM